MIIFAQTFALLAKLLTNMKTNTLYLLVFVLALSLGCKEEEKPAADYPGRFEISKETLRDKIKGGWAGQVIGCTYGGPTEFQFNGTMIQEYHPIEWDSTKIPWYYHNQPGLYDDIYMDLTFVEVFEKEGLDAPALSHAKAFAHAEYNLWHANQAARYNILNGINPPASGYWENNPHSDDIDFQIEADFAGLMCPGMVNTASEICDKVGHIMNYGDGWYGGVYVAAMYSLAFISEDVPFIVKEALKTIPEQSTFYQCIQDVIKWHEQYPSDWKKNWFETQKKWSSDYGCPDGVFEAFNIDAKINAAYIVIGLLYGEGDYGKTLDISTRCGQDSDCNPASAGGILGTMLGYKNIPAYWKQGLDKAEDLDFRYTTISLNDAYDMGYRHALEVIQQNGGNLNGNTVTLAPQKPKAVKLEQGFEGHYPSKHIEFGWKGLDLNQEKTEYEFEFEGIGFVVNGKSRPGHGADGDHTHEIDVFIDGELYETAIMTTNYKKRKHDVTWKFNMPKKKHQVKLVLKNPREHYHVNLNKIIIYNNSLKEHAIY
jgi:ADP-ribosylglycohydrolase